MEATCTHCQTTFRRCDCSEDGEPELPSTECAHPGCRVFLCELVCAEDATHSFECAGCRKLFCADHRIRIDGEALCIVCAVAAVENSLVELDEPAEAVMVSDCCHAGVSWERYDFGTSRETGYHDAGERITCLACGEKTEQILMVIRPAAPQPDEGAQELEPAEHLRKPVKMQGTLDFNQEVA